ncbi:KilA-N domain-containing protein [Nitratidesulfovibrio sp. 1201_IL3209]|uniref:KilA-N domain-containing protein n=1 Tax=Nitratidesulfovibrio sp. 1201_IL3209 TaxID=3084053 RepID=UPI002FD932E6
MINDTAIRFTDDKFVNLTDFWKASGAEYNKRPAHWRETDEAQRFINEVSKKENVRVADLFHITRGRFGGTFAHWQIALAYAKYLSPEFHILCNNIIRRFVEEEQNPDMAVDRAISVTLCHKWRRGNGFHAASRSRFCRSLAAFSLSRPPFAYTTCSQTPHTQWYVRSTILILFPRSSRQT